MKPKILFTRWMPQDICQLCDRYVQGVYQPQGPDLTLEQTRALAADCDGICAVNTPVSAQLLEACPHIRAVGTNSVGYDHIDWRRATELGIGVINAPHAVTEVTAELAIGLLLSVTRTIPQLNAQVHQGVWANETYDRSQMELFGRTMGIVGCGRIGRAVARRAVAMGMRVLYYNRHPLSPQMEQTCQLTYAPLDELLAASDVVSLNLPLTPESHHLFNDKTFAKMKEGAYFINVARGAIVDEAALVRALESGHLRGAGLDVFEFEPQVSEGLQKLPNVVMTPHTGTQTYQVRMNIMEECVQGMAAYLNGETPHNLINPEARKG